MKSLLHGEKYRLKLADMTDGWSQLLSFILKNNFLFLESSVSSNWFPIPPEPSLPLSPSRLPSPPTLPPSAATRRRGEQTRSRPPVGRSGLKTIALLGPLLGSSHWWSSCSGCGESVSSGSRPSHQLSSLVILTPRPNVD